MKLIPETSFTVSTSIPATELKKRLQNNLDTGSVYRFGNHLFGINKDFIGNVSENDFRIRYRFRSTNILAYPPILHGCFYIHPNGTNVKVSMKLHPFIIPLILVYLIFLVFAAVVIVISEVPLFPLLPLLILLFLMGSILPYISFYFDSGRSRRCLEDILKEENAL